MTINRTDRVTAPAGALTTSGTLSGTGTSLLPTSTVFGTGGNLATSSPLSGALDEETGAVSDLRPLLWQGVPLTWQIAGLAW